MLSSRLALRSDVRGAPRWGESPCNKIELGAHVCSTFALPQLSRNVTLLHLHCSRGFDGVVRGNSKLGAEERQGSLSVVALNWPLEIAKYRAVPQAWLPPLQAAKLLLLYR